MFTTAVLNEEKCLSEKYAENPGLVVSAGIEHIFNTGDGSNLKVSQS